MPDNLLDQIKGELSNFGPAFVSDFETVIEGKPVPQPQSVDDLMLFGQLMSTCEPPLEEIMLPDDAASFDGCYVQTPREREVTSPPPPAPNLDAIGDNALKSALSVINGAKLCLDQVSELSSQMGDTAQQTIEMDKAIIKLQELIDGIEPIKRYHDERYYLLTAGINDLTSKLTKINPVDFVTAIPVFVGKYAMAKINLLKWDTYLDINIDPLFEGAMPFDSKIGIKYLNETIANPYFKYREAFNPPTYLGLSVYELNKDEKQEGVMYEDYYNLLSDPINNLFTLQERGLTADPKGVDPELLQTANDSADTIVDRRAAEYEPTPENTNAPKQSRQDIIKSMTTVKLGDTEYYIASKKTYSEFYSADIMNKINTRLSEKRSEMKNSKEAKAVYSNMTGIAKEESVFRWKIDRYDAAMRQSMAFLNWHANVVAEYDRLSTEKQKLMGSMQPDKVVEAMKQQTTCIQDQPPSKEPEKVISLIDSMYGTDIRNPNITKYCYWVEFCKMATVFGLTPTLDLWTSSQPSMRYWPIGMVVPTPAGLVKIPLPMVWIPLTVVSGTFGIFVLLLAMCGPVPSPYVLMIDNTGHKKFIFSLNHLNPANTKKSQEPFGSNDIETRTTPTGKIVKKYPPVKTWAYIDLPGYAATIQDPLERSAYDFAVIKVDQLTDIIFGKIIGDIQALPLPDMIDYRVLKANLMSEAQKANPEMFDAAMKLTPKGIATVLNAIRSDVKSYIEKYVQFPPMPYPINPVAMDALELTDVTVKAMDTILQNNFSNPNYTFTNMFNYAMGKATGTALSYFPGITQINISIDKEFSKVKSAIIGTASYAFDQIVKDVLFDPVINIPYFEFSAYKCKTEVGLDVEAMLRAKSQFILGLKQSMLGPIEQNLTSKDLTEFLGFETISTAALPSLISQYVLSKIQSDPNISMLMNNAADAMKSIYSAVAPLTSASISLIDMIRKLGISGPTLLDKAGIDVNLDFVKTSLSGMIDKAFDDNVGAFLNGIQEYENEYLSFTPIMVKNALLTFIINARDEVQQALYPLSAALHEKGKFTVNGFSLNAFDMIDVLNLPKMLGRLLKILQGEFIGTQMPNNAVMDAMMKALENMPAIPYPAVQAVQTFTPPDILDELEKYQLHPIRILHPVLNYDDLPPWERLSYDNFLFMVFLDQFCHKGKQTGGLTFIFGEKFGI